MHLTAVARLKLIPTQWGAISTWYSDESVDRRTAVVLASVIVVTIISTVVINDWIHAIYPYRLITITAESFFLCALTGHPIRKAMDSLETERKQLHMEQQAFQEFSDEVKLLSVTTSQGKSRPPLQMRTTEDSPPPLKTIRTAYRESVMAIPDFETQYGETFEEHFSAEVGPDIASILFETEQFTQLTKQQLLKNIEESIQQRQLILDGIAREEESLHRSRTNLQSVDHFFRELNVEQLIAAEESEIAELDDQVTRYSAKIDHVIRARQEDIQQINRQVSWSKQIYLQEYLYQNYDFNLPVLKRAMTFADKLDECQNVFNEVL